MKKEIKEHSFDVRIAKSLGLNCAVFLKNLQYWLTLNKGNEHNYHENRYWSYNTLKALQESFPYWSISQIQRIIKKLKESGVIEVGNFNKHRSDRTNWYTINPESEYFNFANPQAKSHDHLVKSHEGKTKSNGHFVESHNLEQTKSLDEHLAKSYDGLPNTEPDTNTSSNLHLSYAPPSAQGERSIEHEDEVIEVEQEEMVEPSAFEQPSNLKEKNSAKKESATNRPLSAKRVSIELPHGHAFAKAWEEWEKHHFEKQNKLTPTSIKRQLEALERISERDAVEKIQYSIEKGYIGLYSPKDQKQAIQHTGKVDDFEQRQRNIEGRKLRFGQNRQ